MFSITVRTRALLRVMFEAILEFMCCGLGNQSKISTVQPINWCANLGFIIFLIHCFTHLFADISKVRTHLTHSLDKIVKFSQTI